jgi:hypothetical protein
VADYRYTTPGVIRLSDNLHIRPDMSDQNWLGYLAYLAAGGEVDPEIVPEIPPLTLAEAKARKRSEIGQEAARRVGLLFPGDVPLGTLALVRELYLSIAPAARAPTAKWTSAGAIVQAALTGVDAVAAAGTVAAVDAVTVAWP